MSNSAVTVNVQMDEKTFRRFARFDTYTLRRRWRSPAIFAAILTAFAFVAFLMDGRAQDAALIGRLLLIIGLGLPAAYFLHYEFQLSTQVRRLRIKKPRPAYFVSISEAGVRVVNNMAREEPLLLSFDQIHAVYRRPDAVYLYHAENRAFILPAKDASVSLASLWDLLAANLPKEKLHA
ncbi:MAG: YcxB family protein [Clostridia bacterium]|nr:YcxB family protein [Clostridia bacterium]